MKKLLSFLALVIMYNVLCAQTTVTTTLQVKSAQGAPPAQVMPMNGGLAYYDVNGFIKKSQFQFLLGKKVDSLVHIDDTTIQVTSQWGNTYNVIVRGLYDLNTKAFVDGLKSGTITDTNQVKNVGAGTTRLAATTADGDTLQVSTLKDSLDIAFKKNGDSSVSGYLTIT